MLPPLVLFINIYLLLGIGSTIYSNIQREYVSYMEYDKIVGISNMCNIFERLGKGCSFFLKQKIEPKPIYLTHDVGKG